MNNSCYSSDLRGKKLLILGGNRISIEIVVAAKDMGVITYVLDWNKYEDAPAKRVADHYYVISLADIDKVVEIIKEEGIDGVITGFTDSYLKYYAEICSRSGLPCYGTAEQFEILSNKHLWKKYCRQYNVPTVDEYSHKEVLADNARVKYPLLVKPSDNSGGRGVMICHDREDYIKAYDQALDYSPSKTVLTERYMVGTEATAFWLICNGNVHLIGLGSRLIGAKQDGVIGLPVGYSFPAENLDSYENNVFPHIKKMFEALKIDNGLIFMQNIIEDDVCHVYDIGYRLTGSLEYKILENLYHYNPLKMLINFAITGEMHEREWDESIITPYWCKYAYNVTISAKPGRIGRIDGVDLIKNLSGVFDVQYNHIAGEEIPRQSKGTLDQVVLRVFCVVDDEDRIWHIIDKIREYFKIMDEEDHDMCLPIFDVDKLYLRRQIYP